MPEVVFTAEQAVLEAEKFPEYETFVKDMLTRNGQFLIDHARELQLWKQSCWFHFYQGLIDELSMEKQTAFRQSSEVLDDTYLSFGYILIQNEGLSTRDALASAMRFQMIHAAHKELSAKQGDTDSSNGHDNGRINNPLLVAAALSPDERLRNWVLANESGPAMSILPTDQATPQSSQEL